ncbi:MAG TPA: tRNA pseudouridine(38-40) synthase TruA [Fluviicola sp.]|nr:tRNA pseudouridine(38-40) synthase TruA [Fluviicola sp.]
MKQIRYAFEIAYCGTDFHGWQIQPNAHSIQGELEKRIAQLLGNTPVSIVGCGRTDAGVHASYYVFHVDLDTPIETEQIIYKLNKMLPDSIVIFKCWEVNESFHARFSATSRTYNYFIRQAKNPFQPFAYYLPQTLDFKLMNEAAKLLLGTQDFTSFSKLHTDVRTNICTVTKAVWLHNKEKGWYFEIQADRFLRNMVRAVVGTLIEVGLGKISVEEFQTIILKQNRSEAKLSVPACGLFLVDVSY